MTENKFLLFFIKKKNEEFLLLKFLLFFYHKEYIPKQGCQIHAQGWETGVIDCSLTDGNV